MDNNRSSRPLELECRMPLGVDEVTQVPWYALDLFTSLQVDANTDLQSDDCDRTTILAPSRDSSPDQDSREGTVEGSLYGTGQERETTHYRLPSLVSLHKEVHRGPNGEKLVRLLVEDDREYASIWEPEPDEAGVKYVKIPADSDIEELEIISGFHASGQPNPKALRVVYRAKKWVHTGKDAGPGVSTTRPGYELVDRVLIVPRDPQRDSITNGSVSLDTTSVFKDKKDQVVAERHYVHGRTLQELVGGKTMSDKEAVRLMKSVAQEVQKYHEMGIVHRDLKPANVLQAWGGRIEIIDFGLAQPVGKQLTPCQVMSGTPEYQPLETLRGENWEKEADVYALGAMLYKLVHGATPKRKEDGTISWRNDGPREILLGMLNDDLVQRWDLPTVIKQMDIYLRPKQTVHREAAPRSAYREEDKRPLHSWIEEKVKAKP